MTLHQSVSNSFANSLVEVSTSEAGEENMVKISSFWQNGPVLILFIRHFACIGCTAQMDTIQPRLDEIISLGVKVVIIGNGAPYFIQGFKETFLLQDKAVEIYTDPSLQSYQNANLKRSIWSVFSFKTLKDYIVSFSKGIGQKSVKGDNWQQGGALLIDRNGILRFHFRNKSVAGIADSNDVVEAIHKVLVVWNS